MSAKRTLSEADQWIKDNYGTRVEFAKQNEFTYMGVARVLGGLSKCWYGEGLAIAEALDLDLDEVRK